MSPQWTQVLSGAGEAGLVLAALIGSIAGWRGVSEWKRQATWGEDRELARRCLRSLFTLRDEFSAARNPLIPGTERNEVRDALDIPHDAGWTVDMRWVAYGRRVDALNNRWRELEVELAEAEVAWGGGIREAALPLRGLVDDWKASASTAVDIESLFPGYRSEAQRDQLKEAQLVMFGPTPESPGRDAFGAALAAGFLELENRFRVHLGRPNAGGVGPW